jgi:hypothetical protein
MIVDGYKESVTDEQLITQIEQGIANSTGAWLNSSEMSDERQKSTFEYAGMPKNHLYPNGVSSIVSTDTTETVEAYLALISELMFNNNKLARFLPYSAKPQDQTNADVASQVTNYCIFKKNKGWEVLNTWVKSALLWKNAILRWDYIEDKLHEFEEFDSISELELDAKLAETDIELVGDIELDVEGNYRNVRLKRTIDNSRVKIENIPPENFLISREATTLEDASFIGIQIDMTRSEIRQEWPEIADKVQEWEKLHSKYTVTEKLFKPEQSSRKEITGQTYWTGEPDSILEANQPVSVTECWIKVDRDGDGIAELKHIIVAGDVILFEEDAKYIPLCSICPFEIPYEFYGLSVADMTRSSTLASTAILRGFVENTYLTNYSPKLADPNVVDFSALQNMKPKDLIPTNGNPTAAVSALPPEQISTGTVPILEYLQRHKEQATGMSKAAQGLQDELFVSGNSEIKLSQVMSASQKRVQHICRRFAETGFKRLCEGVYTCMIENMDKMSMQDPKYGVLDVDISKLPKMMSLEVDVDLGENSNANKRDKLQLLAKDLIPLLNQAGAGSLLKPDAYAIIANQLLNSLDLEPSDYLKDHTTPEFMQSTAQALQEQKQEKEQAKKVAEQKIQSEIEQAKANVRYTDTQSDNARQDNARQLAIAIDTHFQKWADLAMKAEKDESTIPQKPAFNELIEMAKEVLDGMEVRKDPMKGVAQVASQVLQGLNGGQQAPQQQQAAVRPPRTPMDSGV